MSPANFLSHEMYFITLYLQVPTYLLRILKISRRQPFLYDNYNLTINYKFDK